MFFVVTIFLPHGLTDLRELLHAQMVMRCTSARCGGGASTDDVSILRMHCIITAFFLHYQKDAAQSCCPVRSNIQLISSFKYFCRGNFGFTCNQLSQAFFLSCRYKCTVYTTVYTSVTYFFVS